MVQVTLQRVFEAAGSWERGDNLALLDVEEGTLTELGRNLRHAILGGELRSRGYLAESIGAALMLFGARTFGRSSSPFTYDLIGQAISVPGLSEMLGSVGRDNMEKGLRRMFGLRVLQGSGGRRQFRATMLFHSGAAWSLVLDVLRALGRRFGFESLTHDTAETLLQLVTDLAVGPELKDSQRIALANTETQVAVAEQVRLAIEARDWLLRDGLVAPTQEATAEAARRAGIDLRVLVGAPKESAVMDLLGIMFPFGVKTGAAPAVLDWRIDARSGTLPHLSIDVPERIRLDGVPSDVDRARLVCVGDEEGPSSRPILRRAGDLFEHFHGPTTLRLPRPLRLPVTVQAEYRRGAEHREIEAASIGFPEDDVLLFDMATGRRCRRAVAGMRVAIVCPPGASIKDLAAFDRVARQESASCEMWIGELPDHPRKFHLRIADEDHERWLAPAGLGPSLHIQGEEVHGLRSGNTRCYKAWPRIHVGVVGTLTYRVEGPRQDLRVERRRGELRPQAEAPPGRYRVTVEQGSVRVNRSFVLLPEGARFLAASTRTGTRLEASILGEGLSLRCRTTGQVNQGSLDFSPEIRGQLEITVTLPLASAAGEKLFLDWHVLAAPHRVDLLEARGGGPTESTDLGLLRGGGGLLLQGPPSAEVLVDIDGYRFRQRLDRQGERFFPFSVVPSEAFPPGDQPVRIRVDVGGTSFPVRQLIDSTSARPKVSTSADAGGRTSVLVHARQAYPEPVYLQAVPAWKPWAEPLVAATERVQDEREIGYLASFDAEPGPYQITLTRGGRRVVGMALIQNGGPSQPPAHLDALERALWSANASPGERLDDLLRERLRAEGSLDLLASLFIRLDEFGCSWFRIRKAIVDAASRHALEAQLDLFHPEVNSLLLRVFRDLGAPPAAIRYRDFEVVHSSHAPSPEILLSWLERLGTLSAGLLLPAWLAWESHVPNEDFPMFMNVLRGLAEVQEPLKPLPQEELDLVQTPSSENHELGERVSFRARGLVEARRAEQRLRDSDGRRADALRRLLGSAQPPSSRTGLGPVSVRNQKGIPDAVIEIERAVSATCVLIDAWRAASPAARVHWEEARLLWDEFPILFDYWLSRLAAQTLRGAR